MNWVSLGDNSGINKMLVINVKRAFPLLKMKFKLPLKNNVTK